MQLGDYTKNIFSFNKDSKTLPKEIIEFINTISNKDDKRRRDCIATAEKMQEYYETAPKRKYKRRIDVLRIFDEVCSHFPNHTRAEQIRKTGQLMRMTERAVSKHVYKE